METYEQYKKRTGKKSSLRLTKQAWETSKKLDPTMQRKRVKRGGLLESMVGHMEDIIKTKRKK